MTELEVALVQRRLVLVDVARRPRSSWVLVEGAAVEAGGDRQRRRVKHGDEDGGREGQFTLQLPLPQLSLQHHVLQLLVREGPSLPHPGADGRAREVCTIPLRLLGPAGGVVLQRHHRFQT